MNTVFVKVVGFRDVERHALNTVFRLSQERSSHYMLWTPDAPLPPHLMLVDMESYEGNLALQSPAFNKNLKLIAVGDPNPEGAWRTFTRPLNWPDIVQAMDQLFAGAAGSDIDLETGEVALGISPAGVRRTLLVDPSRDHRLYLRARLALVGMLELSETSDAATAHELARGQHFDLVIVNMDTPGLDAWNLVERLVALEPAIGSIVLCANNASWLVQQRAEQAGCLCVLEVPFDPVQIMEMLRKV